MISSKHEIRQLHILPVHFHLNPTARVGLNFVEFTEPFSMFLLVSFMFCDDSTS